MANRYAIVDDVQMFDLTSSSDQSEGGRVLNTPSRPADAKGSVLNMQMPSVREQPVVERNSMVPSGKTARHTTRSASPRMIQQQPHTPLLRSRPSSAETSTVPRSPVRSAAAEQAQQTIAAAARGSGSSGRYLIPCTPEVGKGGPYRIPAPHVINRSCLHWIYQMRRSRYFFM